MLQTEICLTPIGVIRSPLRETGEAPKQGREGEIEGRLVVDEQYRDAFDGLRPGQRIVILYWLHLADRRRLKVHPRGDRSQPLKGVFATRSPHRPNPIAMSLVEVVQIEETTVTVRGLDALDGTPLLDIKCDLDG